MSVAASAVCQEAVPFVEAHGAMTPGTYRGTVADGGWQLDLWPDQSFHLLHGASGGEAPGAFAGRWYANGRVLLLELGAEVLELELRNVAAAAQRRA